MQPLGTKFWYRYKHVQKRTPGAHARWQAMSLGDKRLTDGTESPKDHAPPVSLLLAYAAMLPMAGGALGAVAARSEGAARLTTAWAGAVLCFLSGVRRGLAFRQAGGSTVAQVGSTVWLFVLGAGSLLSPRRVPALVLLLLGYGSEAVLDPDAARRGEAPRYFARLRPVQLLIPIASLGLLLLCNRRLPRNGADRE